MNPADVQADSVVPHVQGCVISLTVSPRSSSNRLEVDASGAIGVRITAPPVDGAANARLLKVLSAILDVPSSSLEVLAGAQSRHKRVLAKGIDEKSAWTAISHAATSRK